MIDVAVVRDSGEVRRSGLTEVGERKILGAVLIPSGFAETGNHEGQEEIVKIARQYDIRMMGPNIYGFYYTPKNLCATFCIPYDVKGKAALSSQSGGIGMAIIGFSHPAIQARSWRCGILRAIAETRQGAAHASAVSHQAADVGDRSRRSDAPASYHGKIPYEGELGIVIGKTISARRSRRPRPRSSATPV